MTNQSSFFISYSANNEDVILNRIFGERSTGFYIDVGAAHPMFENDTKALYDRGWSGINIEPNKSFFEIIVKERPRDRNLNAAVSTAIGELLFFEVIGTGLSTCDANEAESARGKGFEVVERKVVARTLCDILEEAQPSAIDLLKIDVEGFEHKVILSNDWSRYRPNLILAEATFPETSIRRPDVVTPLLEKEGYRRVYFDGLNDYYVEHDFVPPEGAFDVPLNIFDRFIPLAQAQLSQERDFLHEKVESLQEERENALKEINSIRSALNKYLHLEVDLVRAREELSMMHTRMSGLGRQMEGIEVAYAAAEERIDTILRSTSWRITRPLRAIARPRRTFNILMGRRY